MKINMLLPGKVSGHDATFEIDSGAHISLVSKDLVSESDMVPGKITIKSVLGQSQTLPCAGLNVAINGVSKYYKLGVSDRIGSKMIILGCDIGVKDHRHFYDMACDFKQEQVQVKLTRAQSKKLQADATDRQQQQLQDGASPTPLSVISSNAELTVETNHPSIETSCASSIELPLPTTLSFMPSEYTSENSAALSPNQTCANLLPDNTTLNGKEVHESDISDCDGVAIPNSLSNCTAKPVDIPLAKLSGITRSKLCELQAEDNSLKRV